MPKIKSKDTLADIQSHVEGFPKREIKKVGIRGVKVPLNVLRKDGTLNSSSAEVSIYTNLSSETKGANMSRYRIVAEDYLINRNLNLKEYIRELLVATKDKLGATDSYVKIRFDYYMIKGAPASGIRSYIDYKCIFEGVYKNNKTDIYMTVVVPYTSLCPCSKEISDYGAHNQRSFGTIKVKLMENAICWVEDIVDVVESTASAQIVNGLKRDDEAFQTEQMYENPMFVEDMSRCIAETLDIKLLDKTISDYSVVVEHEEIIHTHNALAIVTANRELQ